MKLKPYIIILLFACCSASLWFYFLFAPVVTQDDGVTYYLQPGSSIKRVISELSSQDIILHPIVFSMYIYTQKNAQLKTGEYRFAKGSTPVSIWKQITTGKGLLYRPLIIIPGWTFAQLRRAISQAEGLRQTVSHLSDKQIMSKLGQPDMSPEGEFFPETYFYTKGIADFVILKHAFTLMQNKLGTAWQNRLTSLPYKNAYEALIVASMVEKEAYLNSERPVIASVILNRLQKNMLLQIDPTVIYGMGDRYTGKIHKENLQQDNPYNTYTRKGLPPTPIAIPSLASIEAVMHPLNTDYLYFVAKGDGSHEFSKTLVDHNKAVKAAIKQQVSYFNDEKLNKYLYSYIRSGHAVTSKFHIQRY